MRSIEDRIYAPILDTLIESYGSPATTASEVAEVVAECFANGEAFAPERQQYRVYLDVQRERRRQDEKWGGPDHDDELHKQDWVEVLHRLFIKADVAIESEEFRRRLVQMAAVCIAAVESLDRTTGEVVDASQ